MTVASTNPEIVKRQRRITVDEYHRMIEAGILGEVEVLLEPDPPSGVYRSRMVIRPDETLTASAVTDLTIDVARLFR
jgi:hypothetical protein